MTTLLKKAIKETSLLSDDEQDKTAQIILDEISDETKWNSQFSNSQRELLTLAEKAIKD